MRGISKNIFLDLSMSKIANFIKLFELIQLDLAIFEHAQENALRLRAAFLDIFKISNGCWQ